MHIPVPWGALSGARRKYYESREHAIRRVSIIRERVRGHNKYFISLTFECAPYRDATYLDGLPSDGMVGFDLGKWSVGIATDAWATNLRLDKFALELKEDATVLDKQLSRKRLGNPNWSASKTYRALKNKLSRARRNAVIHRNDAYRRLARELRGLGATLVTEKDIVKGWTRNKRVKDTRATAIAPATLKNLVRQEYNATNGAFSEANLADGSTQTCITCGKRRKVPPKQRDKRCTNTKCELYNVSTNRDESSATRLRLNHTKEKFNSQFRLTGTSQWLDGTIVPKTTGSCLGQGSVTTLRAAKRVKRPDKHEAET